ncbi:MAG: HEPN domain-containing protein [bacterium]|nr:HEPN domain-containing protein [bacterium]
MHYTYKDCVKNGYLRKIPASKLNSGQSLESAKKWLVEAESTFKNGNNNSSVIASYMVMFHAARAVLFNDGWREKNHLCISLYLKEHYVKNGKLEDKWIDLLDYQRKLRHDDQYNLNFFISSEDAEKAIETSKSFLNRIKKLFKAKS